MQNEPPPPPPPTKKKTKNSSFNKKLTIPDTDSAELDRTNNKTKIKPIKNHYYNFLVSKCSAPELSASPQNSVPKYKQIRYNLQFERRISTDFAIPTRSRRIFQPFWLLNWQVLITKTH